MINDAFNARYRFKLSSKSKSMTGEGILTAFVSAPFLSCERSTGVVLLLRIPTPLLLHVTKS